ncbi:hypothetical protein TNCV_883551 [Trichonephila clavipes]|nr:hypothetical protein TNCV_883551 [Trichonephila clavipes]
MSRRKQQSAFDQVSKFDRRRIVAYRDCGLSFREIGSCVGRNQTTADEKQIDRERQGAGASAQNEWQRGTEANMRKKPKTGEGRGNKRRQSQPGRDVGGAKHETGRKGQNDKRHGRERTEAGAAKEGNMESEQNKLVCSV